ncbi:ABC transporter permease [Sphingobacterium sp. HJSM2_6]|uniref:ABC transporter permease n=1 Tax=Sphingobacterium sp. HJSM2_6 TaxID=3366264 RepID=UPI003BEACD07
MIKAALRSLKKTKMLSSIHVLGLGIALGASIVLYLTAMFELSFDKFHDDINRIGVLYKKSEPTNGIKYNISMEVPLAPQLKSEIPTIEYASRYANGNIMLRHGDKEITSSIKYVDKDFLAMFSFPVLSGRKGGLESTDEIVLSKKIAMNLFGSTDIIGQSVEYNQDGQWTSKTITAVLEDLPANSSLRFNSLISFEAQPDYFKNKDNWEHQNHEVFVKLKTPKIEPSIFAKELVNFSNQHFKESNERLKRDGARPDGNGLYISLNILPLADYHFSKFGVASGPSASYPWILLILAGLILFIACSNFINLTLAHSITRNREIATRKTLGGSNWQIIKQLWTESFMICCFGLVLGMSLSSLLLPSYNANMDYQLKIIDLFQINNLLFFIIGFIMITLIAGGLPAWKIANTTIIQSLKGSAKIKASKIRSSLTVVQFIIAITLMIATIVISTQLTYMSNRPLGFNKHQVISIPIGRGLDKEDALSRMRIALEKEPWVGSVSGSDVNIGRGRDGGQSRSVFGFEHDNREMFTNFMRVDFDYLQTLGIKLLAGRDFDRQMKTDTSSIIINKQMAAQFGGVEEVVGKKIGLNGTSTVIGVIDDFNFQDLKNSVEPLTLSINPKIFAVEYIFVQVQSAHLGETLKEVNRLWKTVNPAASIEPSYLDENTQNLYQSEKRFSNIVITGTSIAIIISSLGLFALALMTINQRIKEIGIRKVLGSSITNIILLLSKDFLLLILLAFLIASPIAWYVMNLWLKDYAYRIHMSIWMFILAGSICFAIAWLTIAWQTMKAAKTNPVNSLRDE